MKIWIDLTNSPHVNFFKPFINKWKGEDVEIIITTRNLANTIDLIEQNNWKYREVGGHAGRSKIKKILFFPKRVWLLWKYLRNIKPDIGISQSSFYSPLVGKLLHFPTIYLNDNEHAKGNYLAFRYASINLLPESLKDKADSLGWNKKYNIEYYSGVKEGLYLSHFEFSKDRVGLPRKIYIRLEPWTAQYYSGKRHFMDDLILELKDNYQIIILPRSDEQKKHYKAEIFNDVIVADKPIALEKIYSDCLLFIGAGGSMTRELAVLGIPTVSVYQDELLEVDKYLIKNNIMFHNLNPDMEYIERILKNDHIMYNTSLISKGMEAFDMINSKIIEYGKN